MSFPIFDQSLPSTNKTNQTLENELSNIRSILTLNQQNESNSWKWNFQYSINPYPQPTKRIKLLKTNFPIFDQFLPSTNKTNQFLENELSNIRSILTLNQQNESNTWKWTFQYSINFYFEPTKRIKLLKMKFPIFDQSLLWTNKTNQTLENELSNIRSILTLNQQNESNSWKRTFQYSINPYPEPTKRIKLLKMNFPIFDQSLPWTNKTNQTLENELSNIWSMLTLNQQNESNSWKWTFQYSINPHPEPTKRIKLLKMNFPIFDQSLPWTNKTNQTLENELSNIRSILTLNQQNESNSWKSTFQLSINPYPRQNKRIKLLKMNFPIFDQSLPSTNKTNQTLENELSNIRSILTLNQQNESNSWKSTFQYSINAYPEPTKRIKLLKMNFPIFDQSLPWTNKTNQTLENQLSNIRLIFTLNQHNESNSWKWTFQYSINPYPEPTKQIKLLKINFPIFDQCLPSTNKTNQTLENQLSSIRSMLTLNQQNESNSWKWTFQYSINPYPQPTKRIKLLKMNFPIFDQSLPSTNKTNQTLENELSNIRSMPTLNQQNESNSWKSTFQYSINPYHQTTKRIKLLKMNLPIFDQFLLWTNKTIQTLENELSNISSILTLNQQNQSNSWKWAFQYSINPYPQPTKRIKLLKMNFPIFDQSLPSTNKTNQTLENEISNIRSILTLNQQNESNS